MVYLYIMYSLSTFLIIIGLFSLIREKKQRVRSRIEMAFNISGGSAENQDGQNQSTDIQKLTFRQRILAPLWKQVKQLFKRNLSSEKREKIELKLLRAGSPRGMSPVEFRIFQLVTVLITPIGFVLYGNLIKASVGIQVLLVIAGMLFGAYLPNYYLKQKTKTRNRLAVKELPDFLDLLTVSIEAGLGFDSALSKVVAKKEGVLSEEFQRCLEEIRLGKTRREALTGVRERLINDDIVTLIGSIIQAEYLGIGMAQNLNVQSDELRNRRKQRAEEQAMKAPIKMLFPLVLFIFPCIFIVLLGPAVINIITTL